MVDKIDVYEQNSIWIESRFGVIYIDPFQMKEEPKNATYILITHGHYDHFSPDDIAKVVGPHTILVVPEKMEVKRKKSPVL